MWGKLVKEEILFFQPCYEQSIIGMRSKRCIQRCSRKPQNTDLTEKEFCDSRSAAVPLEVDLRHPSRIHAHEPLQRKNTLPAVRKQKHDRGSVIQMQDYTCRLHLRTTLTLKCVAYIGCLYKNV